MITKSEELHQHTFIALCSNKGIECYVDVTNYLDQVDSWSKSLTWAILQGESSPPHPDNSMLRKMFLLIHSKRVDNGEIYIFKTDNTEFEHLIVTEPDIAIQSIKQSGTCIYPFR